MHTLCLPLNLGQLKRIHNLFWLFTKLARTSRRQTGSGVIAPLEEALCRSPKQRKKQQAPSSPYLETHQRDQDRQGDSQFDPPGCQAFLPFGGADIWNTYRAGGNGVHITW